MDTGHKMVVSTSTILQMLSFKTNTICTFESSHSIWYTKAISHLQWYVILTVPHQMYTQEENTHLVLRGDPSYKYKLEASLPTEEK